MEDDEFTFPDDLPVPGDDGAPDHLELRSLPSVSLHATDYQREARNRLGLPFELLIDASMELTRALGLPCFEAGGETYLKRLTLVTKEGVVQKTFYPVHPPDEHASEVLE